MIRPVSSGLQVNDFRCVGDQGISSPFNSYAHSIAWFKGRLYIGTFRNSLCLVKRTDRIIPPTKMDFWPVNCPVPEDAASLRAEIIAYDPTTNQWELVHQSEMVEEQGRIMPRDLGYRGMGVYQGKGDSQPCLYVGPISRHGCKLLRSGDGQTFANTAEELDGISVRTLLPVNGKLYTSIVGARSGYGNESSLKSVYETDDPASGKWREASHSGFGDPSNNSVFDIEEFNGYIYASTMNTTSGFQLWKSKLEGKPPYRWHRVLTAGAYRGFLNEFGLKLTRFGDCLYVGSGIASGGYDRIHIRGPGAAEVLRVWPDDSWDLVVGTPRITPDGMKYPTSGMGPGFDNFLNGYMWFMTEHNGWLYIGTFNGAGFFPFKPHSLQTAEAKSALESYIQTTPAKSLDDFLTRYGGCHLWRTQDGERFYPVTRDGFGNSFNMGIRRMLSTPHGLFVGTANPFGPEVGVYENGAWSYQHNPHGGIEVWLGNHQRAPDKNASTSGPVPGQTSTKLSLRLRRRLQLVMWLAAIDDPDECHLLGYWPDGVNTPVEACQATVESLVGMMAQPIGPVLEVGCGNGVSTKIISEYFRADQVISVDELQDFVDRATVRNDSIRVYPMLPAQLEFEDESFENVISIEQPPTFNTREAFLQEAFRVLRPGGTLSVADILFSKEFVLSKQGVYRSNHLASVAAYRRLLEKVGFVSDIRIKDVSEQVFRPFVTCIKHAATQRFKRFEITETDFNRTMYQLSQVPLFARHYLLVSARKPAHR